MHGWGRLEMAYGQGAALSFAYLDSGHGVAHVSDTHLRDDSRSNKRRPVYRLALFNVLGKDKPLGPDGFLFFIFSQVVDGHFFVWHDFMFFGRSIEDDFESLE